MASGTEDTKYFEVPGQHTFEGVRLGSVWKAETVQRIKDTVFDKEDIISLGHQKTGTTWVHEILYAILHVTPDECPPSAGQDQLLLEIDIPGHGSSLDRLPTMTRPRLLRSHLSPRFFAKNIHDEGPKFVIVVRNPKDTIVSLFHFYQMNKAYGSYEGTFDEFFELYKNERLLYEDFCRVYSAWLKIGNHPRITWVKYENLSRDPEKEVRRLVKFIGKDLTNKQIDLILRRTSFKQMDSDGVLTEVSKLAFDESKSKFYRKGKVGDWKNYFSEEQSKFVDNQYEMTLKPLGLELEFEM